MSAITSTSAIFPFLTAERITIRSRRGLHSLPVKLLNCARCEPKDSISR